LALSTPNEGQKKHSSGVIPFTRVLEAADYTSITGAETHLDSQVPNPRRTVMTKLVLAAVAALSLLASPVLAGPGGSWDDVVQKSGDFQMQGR
jgi:hypothetical protein